MCSLVHLKRSIGCRDMAISSFGIFRSWKAQFTHGLLLVCMLQQGMQTMCKLFANFIIDYCVNFVQTFYSS